MTSFLGHNEFLPLFDGYSVGGLRKPFLKSQQQNDSDGGDFRVTEMGWK